MSLPSDPLERLAILYGIETGYTDAFGKRRVVPRETLRELLLALGVEPFGERQLRHRLDDVLRRRASRLVEPVVVITASEAAIPFHLPDSADSSEVVFEISTADGETFEGRGLGERSRPPAGDVPSQRLLPLPRRLPVGEHQLAVRLGDPDAGRFHDEAVLYVTPERCALPDDLGVGRMYGLAAQVYGLRSDRQLGIGDFADLADLGRLAGRNGASLVGVNPLHALFPSEPLHFSPYSPSNRSFLNPIYIALDRIPELAHSHEARRLLDEPEIKAAAERARRADLIDYGAVWPIKRRVLEVLFREFRARHLRPGQETGRGKGFFAFARELGKPLFLQACFDALHEAMLNEHGIWSWREWPAGYRAPRNPEVGAFAAAHGERIAFFQWLQWVADEQLGAAHQAAREAGAPVGLYRDLAVGVHPDGASAWSFPDVTVSGVSIGAPPDAFNPRGQNWGLAPFSPVGLRQHAYRPLIQDVAQNMRHAGAIRIDHVMGLARLFWIPAGASPAEGAYVRYPSQDLMRLIALASVRERCLVIGEDLGTVEPSLRETMRRSGVLSYRVLWFERSRTGGIQPAKRYPRRALITVSTHDLPTLAGYFTGRDLDWRERLDLYPGPGAAAAAREERKRALDLFLRAFRRAGLWSEDMAPDHPAFEDHLIAAAHAWLAATPSQIMMVQLEDLTGDLEQANLPGTTDQHPNWRRRMPFTLDRLADLPALAQLRAIMRAAGRSTSR